LTANAAIPDGYTGTPHLGTAWPIPGRIDFENFDEGGQGIGWSVDDHTGNFGIGGCGGNDYRNDLPHPQICKTNGPGEVDTFTAGPMQGGLYPSEAMPQSLYIGYTHGVDWVKLTVNVREAGTYRLSSTWASEPGGAGAIHFQVLMNDVMKADVTLDGTGGYHNWIAYDDFAEVQLEAGVQVLQFAVKSMHLNYDYLQLSLVLPGGGVDDGSNGAGGAGGTSGEGGASGAGGTEAGGAGGSAGETEAGGAGGAAGSAEAGGSGGSVATAGSSAGGSTGGEPSSAAGSPASAAGDSGADDMGEDDGDEGGDSGGCSLGQVTGSSSALPLVMMLGVAALARRRSRRAK
jgi:hypothetical protein